MTQTMSPPQSEYATFHWETKGDNATQYFLAFSAETLHISELDSRKKHRKLVEAFNVNPQVELENKKNKFSSLQLADFINVELKGNLLTIKHLKKGKAKNQLITANEEANLVAIADQISTQVGKPIETVEQGFMEAFWPHLIGAGVAIFLAGIFMMASLNLEDDYEATGRRAGMKKLMHGIMTAIGETGMVAICAGVILIAILWCVITGMKFKKNLPTKEMILIQEQG